jgi:hypothetical protein
MNLPGFTAEKSLRKTTTNYRIAGARYEVNAAIYPAFHWTDRWPLPDPMTIFGLIIARACCRNCANECFYKSNNEGEFHWCLSHTCTGRCDPHELYGGCARLFWG